MKIIVPDYYRDFKCIADKCRHTCCEENWDVDIDSDTLKKYMAIPEIAKHIDNTGTPHIRFLKNGRCPFLKEDNLCRIYDDYGKEMLCQICTDHPRYRNFFSARTEMGIGLVCEEAARIILFRKTPMKLCVLSDDGANEKESEDETRAIALRDDMLSGIRETGINARLFEYLIYRHLAPGVFDGTPEARMRFILNAYKEITQKWQTCKTDDEIIDVARMWSYENEYTDEEVYI